MSAKPPNHRLSEMKCPASLEDVDLFGAGAQEHWYEAYEILHRECPVRIIAGEGLGGKSDGYILTRYSDISGVVRDPERFKPTLAFGIEAAGRALREAEERGSEADLPPGVRGALRAHVGFA